MSLQTERKDYGIVARITCNTVNAALENIKYIRKCYAPLGSNCVVMVGYIEKAIATSNEQGDVSISIYVQGEVKNKDDFYMEGNVCDITDIIIDWAFPWYSQPGEIPEYWESQERRKEAVRRIVSKLRKSLEVNHDQE